MYINKLEVVFYNQSRRSKNPWKTFYVDVRVGQGGSVLFVISRSGILEL